MGKSHNVMRFNFEFLDKKSKHYENKSHNMRTYEDTVVIFTSLLQIIKLP